jgi:hypothetical protein
VLDLPDGEVGVLDRGLGGGRLAAPDRLVFSPTRRMTARCGTPTPLGAPVEPEVKLM